MEQEAYRFIKSYENPNGDGKIRSGAEIRLFRGFVYCDGAMLSPYYASVIRNILNNPTLKDEYLQKVDIIYNKA